MGAAPGRQQTRHLLDPAVVGELECAAWVAYYRRNWLSFLRFSVGMIGAAFGMRPDRTVRGAWYLARASRLWSPLENDPAAAANYMRRFYRLVSASGSCAFDAHIAADLELEWWRVHRYHQHGGPVTAAELADSLSRLYACIYQAEPDATRRAAELRVSALNLSDRWVADGKDPASPALLAERAALVSSYAALRDCIDQGF